MYTSFHQSVENSLRCLYTEYITFVYFGHLLFVNMVMYTNRFENNTS